MKNHPLISLMVGCALSTAALSPASVLAQTGTQIVQGRLAHITSRQLTLELAHDDIREFKFDLAKAKCFDFRKDPMSCQTLIGVGYANKARITLVDGVIQRVDIIELQQ
jgi:hypothetical protein